MIPNKYTLKTKNISRDTILDARQLKVFAGANIDNVVPKSTEIGWKCRNYNKIRVNFFWFSRNTVFPVGSLYIISFKNQKPTERTINVLCLSWNVRIEIYSNLTSETTVLWRTSGSSRLAGHEPCRGIVNYTLFAFYYYFVRRKDRNGDKRKSADADSVCTGGIYIGNKHGCKGDKGKGK